MRVSSDPVWCPYEKRKLGHRGIQGEVSHLQAKERDFGRNNPADLTLPAFRTARKLGAWGAQSVKHLTLAEVTISWFVNLSPVSGSALTAWSLEPASFGSGHDLTVCEFKPHVGLCVDSSQPGTCFRFRVSLSLCPSLTHTHSLSQK